MKRLTLYIYLLLHVGCFSQEVLQLRRVHFNRLKKTEFSRGDVLEYKIKGERRFRKNEIIDFHDSILVFETNFRVSLREIKAIRLRQVPRLLSTLQTLLVYAGCGFFILDTSNNFILRREQAVNEKAVLVSACFLSGAAIIKLFSVRRIRINRSNSLKIIDADYFKFNLSATH